MVTQFSSSFAVNLVRNPWAKADVDERLVLSTILLAIYHGLVLRIRSRITFRNFTLWSYICCQVKPLSNLSAKFDLDGVFIPRTCEKSYVGCPLSCSLSECYCPFKIFSYSCPASFSLLDRISYTLIWRNCSFGGRIIGQQYIHNLGGDRVWSSVSMIFVVGFKGMQVSQFLMSHLGCLDTGSIIIHFRGHITTVFWRVKMESQNWLKIVDFRTKSTILF